MIRHRIMQKTRKMKKYLKQYTIIWMKKQYKNKIQRKRKKYEQINREKIRIYAKDKMRMN